ncbi:Mut11, partial [Trichoderma gamsii]
NRCRCILDRPAAAEYDHSNSLISCIQCGASVTQLSNIARTCCFNQSSPRFISCASSVSTGFRAHELVVVSEDHHIRPHRANTKTAVSPTSRPNMASTTLILILGTYFCWAAMVSRELFHQVWAITLLFLVFLTDKCFQQDSTIHSFFYGTLCVLNLAVCIALSPVQVFLFKQKATYQTPKRLDEFLPKSAPGSRRNPSISVDLVAVHGLGSSPEAAWAYKLDTPRDEAGNSTPTHNCTQTTAKPKYGPIWLRDFLPLDALQARVLVYYHNSGWQAHALGMSLRDYGQDLLTSIEGVRQTEAV